MLNKKSEISRKWARRALFKKSSITFKHHYVYQKMSIFSRLDFDLQKTPKFTYERFRLAYMVVNRWGTSTSI